VSIPVGVHHLGRTRDPMRRRATHGTDTEGEGGCSGGTADCLEEERGRREHLGHDESAVRRTEMQGGVTDMAYMLEYDVP